MLAEQLSVFDREAVSGTLSFFSQLGLLSRNEPHQVLSLLDDNFEFAETMRFAESIHVHVEVDSVKDLPDDEIQRRGGVLEITRYEHPDMVKYSYPAGINLIFSAFTISQEDLVDGLAPEKPFVDHFGVDLRDESSATRAIFDHIPTRASEVGWRHVHQAAPLYCCYTACGEKHWVYPAESASGKRRPIEFAFGSLRNFESNMGCDYRPIDPAHALAGTLPTRSDCCE